MSPLSVVVSFGKRLLYIVYCPESQYSFILNRHVYLCFTLETCTASPESPGRFRAVQVASPLQQKALENDALYPFTIESASLIFDSRFQPRIDMSMCNVRAHSQTTVQCSGRYGWNHLITLHLLTLLHNLP